MAEVSQGLFPDNIALQFSTFSAGRLEHIDIEVAYSGREVRRSRYPFGGYRHFQAQTAPLTQLDAEILRDFLRSMRGRLFAFYLFPPDVEYYLNEPAGTVTGSSTFLLPFKQTNLTDIKVGGITASFSVQPNIGANGEDQVTFYSGGAGGGFAVRGGSTLRGGDVLRGGGTPGVQTGPVTITGYARPRVLVRSDVDDLVHSFMMTPDYRSIWNLTFREVA